MTTRTVSEANFSPRKDSKRQNNLTTTEAESALDADELKGMLADQRILLTAMGDYVSDLIDVKTEEKDPRQLLKMLLLDGWIDDKGRITNKDGELTLVWKEVRRFNTQQKINLCVKTVTRSVQNVLTILTYLTSNKDWTPS